MSAIATFSLIPTQALDGLLDAATPKETWLGKSEDTYPVFLSQNSRKVATYGWSGYVLLPLLMFLQERGIDLLESGERDDLALRLAEARKVGCVILTYTQRVAHLGRLIPEAFSLEELEGFYNEFNGVSEGGVGVPMREGIRALAEALGSVDQESVVLITIG